MNERNISISTYDLQEKMDKVKPGMNLYNLLYRVISEYGIFTSEDAVVYPLEIDYSDKKLILSYILNSEDFEWSLYSPFRLELVFREHIKFINSQINNVIDDVHSQYLSDNYTCVFRHKDNNEPVWRTR